MRLDGEPEEEAQLLYPQICARKLGLAVARVRRLDQAFEHIERRRLDAVAEQELLGARELLDRGHQPHQKLEVGFDRRPCFARVVGHGLIQKKRPGLRSGPMR
jgi:hypothetical protein